MEFEPRNPNYRVAFSLEDADLPELVRVIGQLARRFGVARRVLNVLTDRFLFRFRDRWFGISGR